MTHHINEGDMYKKYLLKLESIYLSWNMLKYEGCVWWWGVEVRARNPETVHAGTYPSPFLLVFCGGDGCDYGCSSDSSMWRGGGGELVAMTASALVVGVMVGVIFEGE